MTGTYTLGVTNVGTATATSTIVVTDTLPAGVAPTAASGDGFVCSVSGQTVTCTREADLAPGASAGLITITVTFGPASAGTVVNTARVAQATGETELENNRDDKQTVVIVVPPTRFDLVIDKTGPVTAEAGSSISYALNVRNAGPNASPGFTVTDTLSSGQTATGVTAGADYSCSIASGGRSVTCVRSAGLAPGGLGQHDHGHRPARTGLGRLGVGHRDGAGAHR